MHTCQPLPCQPGTSMHILPRPDLLPAATTEVILRPTAVSACPHTHMWLRRRSTAHAQLWTCPLLLPLCSGFMKRYLALFDAAGQLSSLQDAEFIAMLQLMGRLGAVSCAFRVRFGSLALSCKPATCCDLCVQMGRCVSSRGKCMPAWVAPSPGGRAGTWASCSPVLMTLFHSRRCCPRCKRGAWWRLRTRTSPM